MDKIDSALRDFRDMDELSSRSSIIHRLNPLAKFIITVYYIMMVVSCDKYDFNRLAIMVLYPVFMFGLSDSSFATFVRKLKYVLPLVVAVGIINPFLDHTEVLRIGQFTVTGGLVSMITLMLKGVFSLMASYILVATTEFDVLMAALRKIHVPGIIVTLMLLTYRYIAIMMEEVSVMTMAYKLRAPGQKGIHYSAWGSFLGQLLLRSMDRAEEIYSAMALRGFDGNFIYAHVDKMHFRDLVYITVSIASVYILRMYDIASWLGRLFV